MSQDTINEYKESMKERFKKSSLEDLLINNKEVFIDTINNTVDPKFKSNQPSLYKDEVTTLGKLNRKPYPKQAEIITAGKVFLKKEDSLLISAEMGTGKTMMGIGIMDNPKNKINMVLCPPHLVKKWKKEIEETIEAPFTYEVIIVKRWTDLIPFEGLINGRRADVKKRYFFIVSREKAKLSYPKKIVGIWNHSKEEDKDGYVNSYARFSCPKCKSELKKNKIKCINEDCNEPLLVSNNPSLYHAKTGTRFTYSEIMNRKTKVVKGSMHNRLSISEYVSKRWKRKAIDCLIIDESHEYKGGNTGQGNAMATLCDASKKKIALTGTVLNGYASSLFYIMWRLKPKLMVKLDYKYEELQKFIEQLGTVEIIEKTTDEVGVNVKKGRKPVIKEKAKISPLLLANLLNFTIFLKLKDIKFKDVTLSLPDYKEHIEYIDIKNEDINNYRDYINNLSKGIRFNKKLLGAFAVDAINVPDNFNIRVDRLDGNTYFPPKRVIDGVEVPIVGRETVDGNYHPKDKKLFSIIKNNLENDRKVLVYVTYTNSIAQPLLESVKSAFPDNNIKMLPASVKPQDREQWIAENNCDVLITNPELVKTGLDLLEYPTIVFFQLSYNLFTLKQASRRSWRLGQRKNVDVHYLVYNNTAQIGMLNLMSQKLTSANMIEGTLSTDDDLQSLSEDSIQTQLAQELLGKTKTSDKKTSLTDNNFKEEARDWNTFEVYYNDMLDNVSENDNASLSEDIIKEIEPVVKVTAPVVIAKKTVKKVEKVTDNLFDNIETASVVKTAPVEKIVEKIVVPEIEVEAKENDNEDIIKNSNIYDTIQSIKSMLDDPDIASAFESPKKIVKVEVTTLPTPTKEEQERADNLYYKEMLSELSDDEDEIDELIANKEFIINKCKNLEDNNISLADSILGGIENITTDYADNNTDSDNNKENFEDIGLSDIENLLLIGNKKEKIVDSTPTKVEKVVPTITNTKKDILKNEAKELVLENNTNGRFVPKYDANSLFAELNGGFEIKTTCLFFNKDEIFNTVRDSSLVAS